MLLGVLVYQDFSSRHIGAIPLLSLAVCIIVKSIELLGVQSAIIAIAINMLILAMQLGLLWLFFKIKDRKSEVSFLDGMIGKGDVLFFLMFVFSFNSLGFVVVFTSSLIFSLMMYLLLRNSFFNKLKGIPLAGLQALFLIFLITGSELMGYKLIAIDQHLMTFMYMLL
ncbi:MAG: hypothetical protein JEZ03_06355 [Bacteroidales bacterium]|nr:hypothetical protein [Bacteroidales bacterium]